MFSANATLGANRWPVVRLVAGSRTEVMLLSSSFFAITTHWHKCTLPCCGQECKLCELLPARGLFYAAVVCNSRVSILELGSQSSSLFEQHAKVLHGGMRPGLVFELTRRGAKTPVRSEVIREVEKCTEVVQLDLAAHVMALYKFPCPNPCETIETYERRCRSVAKARCDRTVELILNVRDRQAAR